MSSADATSLPTFDPPGPGPWEQDSVHFPAPLTRYWAETHPAAVRPGHGRLRVVLRAAPRRPADGVRQRHRRTSSRSRRRRRRFPQRFQRAEEVLEGKLWREQLREWDEVSKPNAIAKHRELQAVDPDALSDEELAAYLERCRDHHAAMIAQHMRYTASAMIPTGDFLAHAGEWTGLPPAQLLGLMRGASPVSAGASAELSRLIAAIRADARAQELLASDDDPAGTLAALRERDGEVGAAMSAYLDLVGNRLLDGFDISRARALNELPDAARCVRCAGRSSTETGAGEDDVEALTAGIRAKVPGRAPGGVRRAARRGAPALPPPRRARRVQRHLGLRDHAPGRAGRRPQARRARRHPRVGAPDRRDRRRDAGTAHRLGRPVSGRARRTRGSQDVAHGEGRAEDPRPSRAAPARRARCHRRSAG